MKSILKIALSLVYIVIIYLYFHLEILKVFFSSELETSAYIVFFGVLLLVVYFIYKAFSLLINGINPINITKIIIGFIILSIVTIFFYTTSKFIYSTFSLDECPPELYGACD